MVWYFVAASYDPGSGVATLYQEAVVNRYNSLLSRIVPYEYRSHVRETLNANGAWMIVEPMAQDDLSGNLNPVGRIYYAASTVICLPTSLSQEVGLGLGAQAGEQRLREVVTKGGFSHFRRASETPFNLILEARP